MTRLSSSSRVIKRDWCRCIRPGRMGMGRSSPSESSPDDATILKAYWPRCGGAFTENSTVSEFCGSAFHGFFVASGLKISVTVSSVSGSIICRYTSPDRSDSPALLIVTFSLAKSPSRRNLGMYGRTMSSFRDSADFSRIPCSRVWVMACTKIRHEVTLSGT